MIAALVADPLLIILSAVDGLFDGVPASQVTFELSEDVTGFDASDVPTDNGSLSRSSAIDG